MLRIKLRHVKQAPKKVRRTPNGGAMERFLTNLKLLEMYRFTVVKCVYLKHFQFHCRAGNHTRDKQHSVDMQISMCLWYLRISADICTSCL